MKRRTLIKSIAAGTAGTLGTAGTMAIGLPSDSPHRDLSLSREAKDDLIPRKNLMMRVGGDNHTVQNPDRDGTSRENLEYKLRHGVRHITAKVIKYGPDGTWDRDEVQRMKDNCDAMGVELECLNLGLALETEVEKQLTPNISLGKSPERDREIEVILNNIRIAGEVGIPAIRYHWRILPILRNGKRTGRGGSTYNAFDIEENWKELPNRMAGRVTEEEWWERIGWFLERVIPVAEEYRVRMAIHPPDPAVPRGYRGVDRWDWDIFEGIKKMCAMSDSPYHGFLLCLGTVASSLENPGRDIYEIIRYVGLKKKIFSVHLRNIKGGLGNFTEVYPDNGDVDFYEVIKVLRDVQYPYSILPDHMPSHPDDPRRWQAFAFGYGYLKALIHAANAEVPA